MQFRIFLLLVCWIASFLQTAASLIDAARKCCHLDSWEIKDRSRKGKKLLAKCPEEREGEAEAEAEREAAVRGPCISDEGMHRAVLDLKCFEGIVFCVCKAVIIHF